MITLFYTSLLVFLALVLSFLTSKRRGETENYLGLGDDFSMLQITRAHGNLIENALFFLLLSALLETVAQIPNIATMVLGDLFLISRIAHAYGITRPDAKSIYRVLGTLGTFLVLFIQSILALITSATWLSNNNWGL